MSDSAAAQVPAGHIFLSYASQDAAIAQQVCAALEASGQRCWIAPRDVQAGTPYASAIVEAINCCRTLLVLLSSNAVESPHVLREVERASSKRRPVLTIRLDSAPIPTELEYFLSVNQWLDASACGVEGILPALLAAVRSKSAAATATPMPDVVRSGSPAVPSGRRRRVALAVGALAAMVAVAIIARLYWPGVALRPPAQSESNPVAPAAAPVAPRATVAVLPFANLTGDASKDYLGDGMAEQLIDTLTRLPGLKVPARTSSFAYKGRNVNIRDIAVDLQVGTVLEGSVRAAGRRIRVTAQLINALDGLHLWSQTYDEEFTDIFKLQDKLATEIARALLPSLSATEQTRVAQAPPTQDVEAYQLTLQGFALLEHINPGEAPKALDFFQRAVARDPNYARAHAGIAMATVRMIYSSGAGRSSRALLDAAEQSARRALQLDPNSARAETVLGDLAFQRYNMVDAEAHYRRAAELDPSDALIKFNHAVVQAYVGHMREAVQTVHDAYALAPAIPKVVTFAGIVDSWAARDTEALRFADLAVSLGVPADGDVVGEIRGNAALRAGRYADYLRDSFLPDPRETPADREPAVELTRLVIAALSDPRQRPAALAARTRLYPPGVSLTAAAATRCGYNGTRAYIILGDLDAAFDLANQCLDEAPPGIVAGDACPWQPMWRNFRKDPRFQAYIARRGAIPYYEKYGPPDDCDLKDGKLTCH